MDGLAAIRLLILAVILAFAVLRFVFRMTMRVIGCVLTPVVVLRGAVIVIIFFL
jgi:hypothetical protein